MKGASRTFVIGLIAAAGLATAAQAEECAGKAGGPNLTVHVTGMRSAAGEVAVTVYDDRPSRWLAPGGKLLRQRVKTTLPATKACFHLPAAGVYAVAVYHDANADRDFNRSGLGMPVEGFGFSNDAPTTYGLPKFETVRFRVQPSRSVINVKMRYAR